MMVSGLMLSGFNRRSLLINSLSSILDIDSVVFDAPDTCEVTRTLMAVPVIYTCGGRLRFKTTFILVGQPKSASV
jgi:hypothetical protein